MLTQEQIQKRRPLWLALSELWLDTELTMDDLKRIGRVMADTGLTIEKLREVYLVEVAPVVWGNLVTPAGEWIGFDEEWLCSQILHNLRTRPRWTKFKSSFSLTRRPMIYATEHHWVQLIALVAEYRKKKS